MKKSSPEVESAMLTDPKPAEVAVIAFALILIPAVFMLMGQILTESI
jgi:hypothetical protein